MQIRIFDKYSRYKAFSKEMWVLYLWFEYKSNRMLNHRV